MTEGTHAVNRARLSAKKPASAVRRGRDAHLGEFLLAAGPVIVFAGLFAFSAEIVAAGTFVFGVGYLWRGYFSSSRGGFNPMSVYVGSASIFFGLANLAAYEAVGTRYDAGFNSWAVPDFFFQAQLVACLGVFVPPFGYWCAESVRRRSRVSVVPAVGFEVSEKMLFLSIVALAAAGWVFRLLGWSEEALGTLSTLITLGPNVAIFMLGWRLAGPQGLTTAWKVMLAALIVQQTLDQLLFSYMRGGSLWPSVSLFMALALRRRINRSMALMMVAVAVLFMLFLEPLGELRQERVVGRSRFDRLLSETRPNSEGLTGGLMHLLARVSTSSQLSQVCSITAAEGFLNGETVSYAFFVFIPRIIWPEKPLIAPGQWFAEKIGRGQRLANDRFSNAVNMTVPGELFLNFGWTGTIIGMALFGWLMSVTWNATMIEHQSRNVLGQAMAYMIVVQAITVGSHLGAVFNLALWYLLMLAMTLAAPVAAARVAPPAAQASRRPLRTQI